MMVPPFRANSASSSLRSMSRVNSSRRQNCRMIGANRPVRAEWGLTAITRSREVADRCFVEPIAGPNEIRLHLDLYPRECDDPLVHLSRCFSFGRSRHLDQFFRGVVSTVRRNTYLEE